MTIRAISGNDASTDQIDRRGAGTRPIAAGNVSIIYRIAATRERSAACLRGSVSIGYQTHRAESGTIAIGRGITSAISGSDGPLSHVHVIIRGVSAGTSGNDPPLNQVHLIGSGVNTLNFPIDVIRDRIILIADQVDGIDNRCVALRGRFNGKDVTSHASWAASHMRYRAIHATDSLGYRVFFPAFIARPLMPLRAYSIRFAMLVRRASADASATSP